MCCNFLVASGAGGNWHKSVKHYQVVPLGSLWVNDGNLLCIKFPSFSNASWWYVVSGKKASVWLVCKVCPTNNSNGSSHVFKSSTLDRTAYLEARFFPGRFLTSLETNTEIVEGRRLLNLLHFFVIAHEINLVIWRLSAWWWYSSQRLALFASWFLK